MEFVSYPLVHICLPKASSQLATFCSSDLISISETNFLKKMKLRHTDEGKKPDTKEYALCDSICRKSENRENQYLVIEVKIMVTMRWRY